MPHSRFSSTDDGLCSIGDLQFTEDIRDMIAYSLVGDDEPLRNFLVVMPPGDEFKGLVFTFG